MPRKSTQNFSLTPDERANLKAAAAVNGNTITGQLRLMIFAEIYRLRDAPDTRERFNHELARVKSEAQSKQSTQ